MKYSLKSLLRFLLTSTLLSLLLVSSDGSSSIASMSGVTNKAFATSTHQSPLEIEKIVDLRGGASKRKARTGSLTKKTVTGKKKVGAKNASSKSKTLFDDAIQKYKDIPILTRIYLSAIMVLTLLGLLLGEERAQAVLALDPMRFFFGMELWRPFTAASFMGKPSISWLMSSYYLVQYGEQLERAYGSAQFLVFMATQIGILTLFSTLLGVPFFAQCVITGMLHVISRTFPKQQVQWLIFKVPYWTLPYGLMFADVLQAQSGAAAVPHIMGILSGHFYFFHRFIWPKTGGQDWLEAPDFLVERMDPNAASKAKGKDSINKALKNRKRKGRKLGSA